MTYRAFLDSNVLFSAILSPRGAPREIVRLSTAGVVHALISQQVVEEVKRNLFKKYPELLSPFLSLLEEAGIEVVPKPADGCICWALEHLSYPPDAVLLAAARQGEASYFVTGDKRHFLSQSQLQENVGLCIVSPREFLEIVRP